MLILIKYVVKATFVKKIMLIKTLHYYIRKHFINNLSLIFNELCFLTNNTNFFYNKENLQIKKRDNNIY